MSFLPLLFKPNDNVATLMKMSKKTNFVEKTEAIIPLGGGVT